MRTERQDVSQTSHARPAAEPMPDSQLRGDVLADQVSQWSMLAQRAAAAFGTPCYLSRWRPVARMVTSQERRFGAVPMRSWLSFKTHPVRQLAAEWIRSGRGVEVVSEAELIAVVALGCPPSRLLVNGVAKHTWLQRHDFPGGRVHFDSLAEAEALMPLAAQRGWRVGLRCHVPAECDARDPRFGGQFGLDADEFAATHRRMLAQGVQVEGCTFSLGPRPADTYGLRRHDELCRRPVQAGAVESRVYRLWRRD